MWQQPTTKTEMSSKKKVGAILCPVQIRNKLFIGDRSSASDVDTLLAYNVVAIVNIGSAKNKFPNRFQYLKIPMPDNEKSNIAQYLDQVVAFIDRQRKHGSVLVHCKAGVCRSATFIIAYLMKSEHLSLEQAHRVVKEKRSVIEPSPCFLAAVEKWAPKSEEEQKKTENKHAQ